jgi:nucleoside-triphosphatase THEP1
LSENIRENTDAVIIDKEFENMDDFEKKWQEFVNKYDDAEIKLISTVQRCDVIQNMLLS